MTRARWLASACLLQVCACEQRARAPLSSTRAAGERAPLAKGSRETRRENERRSLGLSPARSLVRLLVCARFLLGR